VRIFYNVIFLFALLLHSVDAFAHGAIAVGENRDRSAIVTWISSDKSTPDEARNEALMGCNSNPDSGGACKILEIYSDTCLGFARGGPFRYVIRFGYDAQTAGVLAKNACIALNVDPTRYLAQTRVCAQHVESACDRTQQPVYASNNQSFAGKNIPGPLTNEPPFWLYLIAGPISVAAILAVFVIFKTRNPTQTGTNFAFAKANNDAASPSPAPPPPQSNTTIPQSSPSPPAAPAQRATLSAIPTPPPPPELPQQAFSDSGPVKGLALRLKRSQRTNALNKILFVLDARMDVSAENRALIQKYSLGSRVVYDSANREAYAAAAKARFESSGYHPGFRDSPGRHVLGAGKAFLNLGMAAVHATVAVLSLRITIDSLMKGVHVECKDMDELLEAEGAIMQAAQNLKGHLDTVTTFDGREETFEL
jgi:hypothetical protein